TCAASSIFRDKLSQYHVSSSHHICECHSAYRTKQRGQVKFAKGAGSRNGAFKTACNDVSEPQSPDVYRRFCLSVATRLSNSVPGPPNSDSNNSEARISSRRR